MSLYFFFDPKVKVFQTTSVANGCAYPVEPPQARASARVLAKHVCQPKSCGCVVNVCCNWEIHIKIPLGWFGGAKEGLRNVNLGVWIQVECSQAVMWRKRCVHHCSRTKVRFGRSPGRLRLSSLRCLLSSPEGLVYRLIQLLRITCFEP